MESEHLMGMRFQLGEGKGCEHGQWRWLHGSVSVSNTTEMFTSLLTVHSYCVFLPHVEKKIADANKDNSCLQNYFLLQGLT